MRTRVDVVAFIQGQGSSTDEMYERKDQKIHYGKQELKDLLDYIYGYVPTKEEEMIRGIGY